MAIPRGVRQFANLAKICPGFVVPFPNGSIRFTIIVKQQQNGSFPARVFPRFLLQHFSGKKPKSPKSALCKMIVSFRNFSLLLIAKIARSSL